ncbi:uncharacterized protein LOC119828713 [Zerene cesonia]|uniref:uncharacterized protein LOC119828713 n=1 Tax=Zerene cesonia TaxID=33412 RepID=UPI0018E595E7|nr:uncharacterized protein LOC119828713 [Zerene cesonia]
MKTALVFLTVLALGLAIPQPRKVFHEHFEDFLKVIDEEAGHDIEHLMEHYQEFEEFNAALDYIRTKDFYNLVHEMEDLPEFKAVVDFLENDNIDITFFIDILNSMIDQVDRKRQSRHQLSGRDMNAFIQDCISEFPKAKLAALFDQKMSEDEGFKSAIDNLQSEEWDKVWNALWESEVFLEEVQTLKDHGIDVYWLLIEIQAVFGQILDLHPVKILQEKMKAAFILLALFNLGLAAPQVRKSFHEHFDDFLDIILEESGDEIEHVMEHYLEFDEFRASFEYVSTKDFNQLIHEMEDLPEFKAVVEFLEGHEIDILFFIDKLNDFIDNIMIPDKRRLRHELSGTDVSSFIQDTIALFPKEKLAALFDEKVEEYGEFKRAMESLQSEEWDQLWDALWESEDFKSEVETLGEHGIDVKALLTELLAIFGQN